MNPATIYTELQSLLAAVHRVGLPLEFALVAMAVILLAFAWVRRLRPLRRRVLIAAAVLLVAGEGVLVWLHWRLYDLAVVVEPSTGSIAGHVAVPLWVESEKLYIWALIVAVLGLCMRRQRDELMRGTMTILALLMAGAALFGHPFSNPLPSFLGQYAGYLQAAGIGGAVAQQAYQGMEAARQYYYNAWFMWVHPPLLFLSYGTFTLSFVATVRMIATRRSSFETTAYRWARLGYLMLTVGMLVGLPWAIAAWSGESWWWSGKVNMSLMMWLLYTAYLHARLYLRKHGMWKVVAVLGVLSFLILVLTYLTTYLVPGAHSYASAYASMVGGVC